MNHFSRNKITKFKVSFNGDWNAFGIATKAIDLSNFEELYDIVDDNKPFYGIFPYWSRRTCNIPEFHKKSMGKFKKGE